MQAIRQQAVEGVVPLILVKLCTLSAMVGGSNAWQPRNCRAMAGECGPQIAFLLQIILFYSSTWFECSDMLSEATSNRLNMIGQFVHCKNATS